MLKVMIVHQNMPKMILREVMVYLKLVIMFGFLLFFLLLISSKKKNN